MRFDYALLSKSATKRTFPFLCTEKIPLEEQLPTEGEEIPVLHIPDGVEFRIVIIGGEFAIYNCKKLLYMNGGPWGRTHALVKKLTPIAKAVLDMTDIGDACMCLYGTVKLGGDVVIYDILSIEGDAWAYLTRYKPLDQAMIDRARVWRESSRQGFWPIADTEDFVSRLSVEGYNISYPETVTTINKGNTPRDTYDLVKYYRDRRNVPYEELIKPHWGYDLAVWPDHSRIFNLSGSENYRSMRLPPYIWPRPGRQVSSSKERET